MIEFGGNETNSIREIQKTLNSIIKRLQSIEDVLAVKGLTCGEYDRLLKLQKKYEEDQKNESNSI